MVTLCNHNLLKFTLRMNLPEIDIIGTGSLATSLAPALEQNGYVIGNIYGRSIKSARGLADNLYQAAATTSLDFSNSKSTIFLLAISDDAIEEVSRELVLPANAVVAHTSGSRNMSVLGYTASPNIGVFYPLQSFSKLKRVSFDEVPILIEAENNFTKKALTALASKISSTVSGATSKQRRLIHLAAIFANNFTNAMLVQADEIMQVAKSNLNLLGPLIEETVNKSMAIGPENAQTGPAVRGDMNILDEHMQMLEKHPDLKATYQLMTQQIIDRSEED
jgi:predicted short-subunit dehydrogenase-like oxidoreductase (DUF2520 family)